MSKKKNACDTHNVPLATNLATAELILHSLRNEKEAVG
jgi:methylglyoxal synthase